MTTAQNTNRVLWLRPVGAVLFVALLGCLSLAAWHPLRDWLNSSPTPQGQAVPSETVADNELAEEPAAEELTPEPFIDPSKPKFNELASSQPKPVKAEPRDNLADALPSPPHEEKPGALTQLISSAANDFQRDANFTARPLSRDPSADALARLLATGAKRLVLAAETLKDEANHPTIQPVEVPTADGSEPTSEEQPTVIVNPSDSGGAVRFLLGDESYTLKPGETLSPTGPWPLVVRFHRGGEHGEARYSLRPGTYRFDVTTTGWQLVTVDNGE